MITVVDIQTNNAYSYGEADGFDRRVFIIYDGVHYDGEHNGQKVNTQRGMSTGLSHCSSVWPVCFGTVSVPKRNITFRYKVR